MSAKDSSPGRVGAVSAVVCNYNGEAYLEACLDALLAQDDAPDEVLVVDNASVDRSVELVRQRYPSVKLLLLPENRGPCVARNAGMRAARNTWVLAVDNDAVLEPDVLGKLRRALDGDTLAIAAQSRSVFATDTDRVHYDGGHFHYVGLYSLRNFCRPLAEAEGTGTVRVDGLIAIAILLDRDAVLDIGGYDERYFILFEDYDLALRLRIAGHECLSVEDAIVLHRGGTPGISFREGVSYPATRAYYHSRNRWILLYKNHHWRTLLVSLPGLLVYEFVWLAFSCAKGHLKPHLEGKKAFWSERTELRESRKQVQATRRVSDRELLVGGPLTLSPQLVASAPARLASRSVSGVLRAWWWIGRWFAG